MMLKRIYDIIHKELSRYPINTDIAKISTYNIDTVGWYIEIGKSNGQILLQEFSFPTNENEEEKISDKKIE